MDQMYVVVFRDFVFDFLHEIAEGKTVIGRTDECALKLNHPCVSRTHALLTRYDRVLMIRDLKSHNGTLINGVTLAGDQQFAENVEIAIGPFSMRATANVEEELARASIDYPSTVGPEDEVRITQLLTETQNRVYQLLMDGLSEKEAAARLGIAVSTLHGHVKAIYRSLGVSSRGELFAYSRNYALFSRDRDYLVNAPKPIGGPLHE